MLTEKWPTLRGQTPNLDRDDQTRETWPRALSDRREFARYFGVPVEPCEALIPARRYEHGRRHIDNA